MSDLIMHPARLSKARLGGVHSYLKANSDLCALGPENVTFLCNSSYYSLTQLSWLLHILNILGQDNATF